MPHKRSPLETAKYAILLAFSVATLFFGFFSNGWHVAEQKWFDGHQRDSESLIIGRMIMSRQDGIFSKGGLPGTGKLNARVRYTDQYLVYDGGARFWKYTTYNSQIGAQGMLFSTLDGATKLLPQRKLRLFHAITSLLSAIAIAAIVMWFYSEFGVIVALFVLGSAIFSQWLVVFGRNLYWSTWAFYVPVAVVMHYLNSARKRSGVGYVSFGVVVFIVTFLKCLFNGYEFMTTVLIMMVVPLVYYSVLLGSTLRRFLFGLLTAAWSSLLAILLSFAILCFQVASVTGSLQDGVDHIVASYEKRTHGDPRDFGVEYSASLKARTVDVLVTYLKGTYFDANNYLSSSSRVIYSHVFKVGYSYLILLFAMASCILYWSRKMGIVAGEKRKHVALLCATWFSILAPLSWFIVFKAHSFVHTHMNFVLWQMPFVFFGFAVCGLVVKGLFRGHGGLKKRSVEALSAST